MKLIKLALAEDIGPGDITTRALGLKMKKGTAVVVAKSAGLISGLQPFMQVFKAISPSVTFRIYKHDGRHVVPGDQVVRINGPLDTILTGERTALNILCLLSGVATMARQFADAVRGYRVKILDTRKTLPGLRIWQKKAVRDGGAFNHRIGLHDMYLLKENHVAAAGSLENALRMASRHRRRTRAKIEVEVKDISELKRALIFKPDYILLDNFTLPMLKKSVPLARKANPSILLEASGNVDLKNIRKIAGTGVDRISIGKMTHSAPALDLSLKVLDSPP